MHAPRQLHQQQNQQPHHCQLKQDSISRGTHNREPVRGSGRMQQVQESCQFSSLNCARESFTAHHQLVLARSLATTYQNRSAAKLVNDKHAPDGPAAGVLLLHESRSLSQRMLINSSIGRGDFGDHHHQENVINRLKYRLIIDNHQRLAEKLAGARANAAANQQTEDTAGAIMGAVRLLLVILICVLLLKLRSSSSASTRRDDKPRRRRDERENGAQDDANESQKRWQQSKIKISGTRTHGRPGGVRKRDEAGAREIETRSDNDHHNTLGNFNSNENDCAHRRHSQPSLGTRALFEERRRRHSCEMSLAATIASLQLPPGPRGLPFLGYLPFLGKEIHLTLTELSQRFGPIYQIFLGGIRVVVLNDAALVRQAFKQTVFSGRPDTQLTRILQGYGIVNSEGALWKEQRAFLHSALRKLGAKSLMSGSNGLEAKIQNQVREFVSDLSAHAERGQPCQVRPMVARAVSSVVGSIVMNLTYRKFEEKEKFDRVIELMQEGFRLFSIAMPLDFIPIFRFLPGVSYAYKKMKRNRAETSAFFQGVADEHRRYLSKTFNLGVARNPRGSLHPKTAGVVVMRPEAVPVAGLVGAEGGPKASSEELENIVARDLVDAYIVQQKRHEKDGKENYFSDQQLVQIMSDIFSAGLETVTSTIEWSILFLILNVHCQEKIQEEIDQIIGRERAPQLEDLGQMPYTEATIYEVLRRSNVVALGNAHATLADATLAGFRIPKGTQVLPNLYGIHMDPRLWLEPEQFNPARFIVNERAQKPDYFIPFSTGRRMCLGDVLAKMEVFLFLVGLLQKYDLAVHPDDLHSPPQVKGTIGVSNAPASFRVALNLRDKSADCGRSNGNNHGS